MIPRTRYLLLYLSSYFDTLDHNILSIGLEYNYSMSNALLINTSAYLPHRSTETALILIINDMFIYLDNKAPYGYMRIFYLVLLDLSSAFDTIDHNILSIERNEIGIHGKD